MSYRVPLVEGFHHFLVGEATDSPEDIIGLRDELHVSVLNSVVHHLHKVACSTGAHVCHTWPVVDLPGQSTLLNIEFTSTAYSP